MSINDNISNDKIIEIIPLKTIDNLFINYNSVKIDKNGLYNNNIKQKKFNKVIFNIYQENNSPQNCNIVTSHSNDNNNNIINNDKINNVYVNNKIDPKMNKSISLFSIQYNNITNNYILTSLTDEIFFALQISCNKNFYLDDSKRYYIQLNETIISILPNNNAKIITIKILNINDKGNNNNKYCYDYSKLPITIGRNNCNININKNYISKIHLIIIFDTKLNRFCIRDNNSTNGSLILLKKGKDVKLEDKSFFFLAKEHFILKR